MSTRTSNIYARIEPEVKEQAEDILNALGIPMSNAIGLFLRQVVIHRGIPFDMKLPPKKPLSMDSLTEAELNAEIQKGVDDIKAGRVRDAEEVFAEMQRKYNL